RGEAVHEGSVHGQALRGGDGHEGGHRRRPDPRRLWLHPRGRGGALLPRREDHADLRGHLADPEARHRARGAEVIASVREFTEYFDGVRRRTIAFFRMIPPARVDWAPEPGEYTCGDIVRHVATCESMFTGVVADGVWRYDGHDRALGASRDEALALLDARHAESTRALARTADAALAEIRPALEPGGRPIRGWRVLMAMCEHEIHHRSQLACS